MTMVFKPFLQKTSWVLHYEIVWLRTHAVSASNSM